MAREFDYVEIGGVPSDSTAQAEKGASCRSFQPGYLDCAFRRRPYLYGAPYPPPVGPGDARPGWLHCSSGFVVLQPCDVAAEVLLTYLRLPFVNS
jgi:hypothetical protein